MRFNSALITNYVLKGYIYTNSNLKYVVKHYKKICYKDMVQLLISGTKINPKD